MGVRMEESICTERFSNTAEKHNIFSDLNKDSLAAQEMVLLSLLSSRDFSYFIISEFPQEFRGSIPRPAET